MRILMKSDEGRKVRMVIEADCRWMHPMVVAGQKVKLAHGGTVYEEEWTIVDRRDVFISESENLAEKYGWKEESTSTYFMWRRGELRIDCQRYGKALSRLWAAGRLIAESGIQGPPSENDESRKKMAINWAEGWSERRKEKLMRHANEQPIKKWLDDLGAGELLDWRLVEAPSDQYKQGRWEALIKRGSHEEWVLAPPEVLP